MLKGGGLGRKRVGNFLVELWGGMTGKGCSSKVPQGGPKKQQPFV